MKKTYILWDIFLIHSGKSNNSEQKVQELYQDVSLYSLDEKKVLLLLEERLFLFSAVFLMGLNLFDGPVVMA
jgi:hypothetical protein